MSKVYLAYVDECYGRRGRVLMSDEEITDEDIDNTLFFMAYLTDDWVLNPT
jgi:hypothetical protein